jgi:hypothetical protein
LYCAVEYTRAVSNELRAAEERRLLEVAKWKWAPDAVEDAKCITRQWEWKAVVRRLISSQAGIIFLGG